MSVFTVNQNIQYTAVQCVNENLYDLVELINSSTEEKYVNTIEHEDGTIYYVFEDSYGEWYAKQGDWLVIDGEGYINIVPNNEFIENYNMVE